MVGPDKSDAPAEKKPGKRRHRVLDFLSTVYEPEERQPRIMRSCFSVLEVAFFGCGGGLVAASLAGFAVASLLHERRYW
jgi:hypothetical protein